MIADAARGQGDAKSVGIPRETDEKGNCHVKKGNLDRESQKFWQEDLRRAEKEWKTIIDACSTKKALGVSQSDPSNLGLATIHLCYGETTFRCLSQPLSRYMRPLTRSTRPLSFYDLGSGSGRILIAAALLPSPPLPSPPPKKGIKKKIQTKPQPSPAPGTPPALGVPPTPTPSRPDPKQTDAKARNPRRHVPRNQEGRRPGGHVFGRVTGIEVLKGLVELSEGARERLGKSGKKMSEIAERISIIQGNFLRLPGDKAEAGVWWEDADVVFATCTCFSDKLMRRITRRADRMKKGSYFLTMTRKLDSTHWKILGSDRHVTSWGDATLHIQVKVDSPSVDSPSIDDVKSEASGWQPVDTSDSEDDDDQSSEFQFDTKTSS